MVGNDRSVEALVLARELIDELESDEVATGRLLRRTRRLFVLTGEVDALRIVNFELTGYPDGVVLPSPRVAAAELRGEPNLATASFESIERDLAQISEEIRRIEGQARLTQALETELSKLVVWQSVLATLRDRLRNWLHDEIVRVYHATRFGDALKTIFEEHRGRVDALLVGTVPEAIASLRSVNTRVLEGDQDALSQALNSCRRLIYVVADKLVPPREPIVVDGTRYDLGGDKFLNRICEHMRANGTSRSRRDSIDRRLHALHDRLSAGVKTGVSPDEARSLVLSTYLILGEVLLVAPPADASVSVPPAIGLGDDGVS